jgi:hypothetical protein
LAEEGGIDNDGSFVGRNDLDVGQIPSQVGSNVKPGDSRTYRYLAVEEGVFMLWSDAGDANGQLAAGLFGSIIVEPPGAEYYRSQVTAETMLAATLTRAFVSEHPDRYNLMPYRIGGVEQYQEAGEGLAFPAMRKQLYMLTTFYRLPLDARTSQENLESTRTALVVLGDEGRIYAATSGLPVINYYAVYRSGPR